MVMGTVVNISIYNSGAVEDPRQEIKFALNKLEEYDHLWSISNPNSVISRMNSEAGIKSVSVDDKTLYLLLNSVKLEEKTGGAFNIRIGPITDLWGFHTEHPRLPSTLEITDVLPLVKGAIYFAGNSCLLGKTGMKLDLGGIAKGYGVDLTMDYLLERGIKSGIVEAGGDLRAFGNRGKGRFWHIGIRHPRKLEELYATLKVGECAVATSGDYQQYFELEGKRYHHIIDPETGYPSNQCVSVTVIAQNCIEADALATALFVMGPDKGIEWLNDHPQYQGIIISFYENNILQHQSSAGIKFNAKEHIFTLYENSIENLKRNKGN
jgi:thiamine biosynthesis lipoprotein